jgi:polyphosphate kinase 2 (PPK2 family)
MSGKDAKGKQDKKGKKGKKDNKDGRLPKKTYERELLRLQAELVKLQEWVRFEGARLVVVFEGRDAAGKGSTIKRVTQYGADRAGADPVVLPAVRGVPPRRRRDHLVRPELVQPRRRRTRDGVLHAR